MADYERLKGIRATTSAKQGDYLYSPRASGSIYGLVKYPDLIKVVSALPDLSGGVYDGYTFFVRVGSGKYRMYSVVGSTATERKPAIDALQEIGNVEAVQPTNGDILRWNEEEGLFVFSHELGEAESDIVALELEIAKIKNGTTVVKKAECDDEGDVIKNTYVGLVEVDYNDVTNTINVEAQTKDGTYLGDDQITLPKATTTKDGLMAKEDKVILDSIPDALDLKADLVGGKVPSTQLPSYVDDVVEVATYADLPLTGETGKIYVVIADETSGNNHSTYRWTGTIYAKIHDELSPLEVKTLYESNADTNEFTDAEKAKLSAFLEANQYYPSSVVEQRLADLLGLTNLQDTAVEYETGNYVFPRGAVFPATLVSDYNWVFLRFITSAQEVRYNFFKPTEASSGNYMTVIIQKSPARYARIMRDNGNLKFDIVDDTNTVQTDLACTMKMWGVKLDGITAEEVSYDNTGSTLKSTTVQGAIDEHDREIEELKYAPIINKSYGDKINATTDFVPNASGKPLLKQVDGVILYAISLISGDLVAPSGTLSFTTTNLIKYYVNNGTTSSTIVGDGNDYVLTNGSSVSKRMYAYNYSTLIANKQYSPLYNTTFDLMTDAQIKIQMDSWVQLGILPNTNLQAITNTKVKTIGKNLSPTNTLSSGGLDATTGLPNVVSTNGRTNFILVKPYTQYAFTFGTTNSTGVYAYFYDYNQVYISRVVVYTNKTVTFTTPSNCYYVRGMVYIDGGNPSTSITSLQLELGSTATTYAPYKSGTLELTHTPLYRLPNGVKDIVRYDNGQYVKDKYVGYSLFNGATSENWVLANTYTNTLRFTISLNNGGQVINLANNNGQSNNFAIVNSTANTGVNCFEITANALFIEILKSRLSTNDVNGLKTWLASNNTWFVYQLATPLLANELVNADGQLIQENPTTIIQEQTLPSLVNMDFTVDTKAQVIANKDAIASNYTALDTTKADKVVLTNLVSNGDDFASGFTLLNATGSVVGGVYQFTPTAQFGRITKDITSTLTDKIYVRSRFKADSALVRLLFGGNNTPLYFSHSGSGNFEIISGIFTARTTSQLQISDFRTSGWTMIEVDYMLAINLTTIFGAGNEPTKEQMDAIMTLKGGYFSTTTLNVIDVMKLFTPKTQEAWLTPTLLNGFTGTLKYRKNTLGQLEIVGTLVVPSGGATPGVAVSSLPSGYFTTLNNAPLIAFNDTAADYSIFRVNSAGGIIVGKSMTATHQMSIDTTIPIRTN